MSSRSVIPRSIPPRPQRRGPRLPAAPAGRISIPTLPALDALAGPDGAALLFGHGARGPSRPVSYGKAAIVGVFGDVEHGAAIIHPRLGKPMREAVGKGRIV